GRARLGCGFVLAQQRAAAAGLGLVGAKEASRRSLGAGRSAEQQSHSRRCRTGTDKRIPKQSALDPRIKKALQSSARKLPDRKLASEAQLVTAPAGLLSGGGKA